MYQGAWFCRCSAGLGWRCVRQAIVATGRSEHDLAGFAAIVQPLPCLVLNGNEKAERQVSVLTPSPSSPSVGVRRVLGPVDPSHAMATRLWTDDHPSQAPVPRHAAAAQMFLTSAARKAAPGEPVPTGSASFLRPGRLGLAAPVWIAAWVDS